MRRASCSAWASILSCLGLRLFPELRGTIMLVTQSACGNEGKISVCSDIHIKPSVQEMLGYAAPTSMIHRPPATGCLLASTNTTVALRFLVGRHDPLNAA